MSKSLEAIAVVISVTAASITSTFAQTNKLWQPGTFTDMSSWRPPCNDCYVQQVEVMVPASGIPADNPNPTCGNSESINFAQVAQDAIRAYGGDPSASGNLIEAAKKFVYTNVRNRVGGDFQKFLDANGPRTPHGLCASLAAMLPASAQIVTAHLGLWDEHAGPGGCTPGQDCSTGFAKFLYPPVQLEGSPVVVATTFINWSHNRDRVARMFIAYRIPAGKPKPVPLS